MHESEIADALSRSLVPAASKSNADGRWTNQKWLCKKLDRMLAPERENTNLQHQRQQSSSSSSAPPLPLPRSAASSGRRSLPAATERSCQRLMLMSSRSEVGDSRRLSNECFIHTATLGRASLHNKSHQNQTLYAAGRRP